MEVSTPWSDVWLGADDWAAAFDAPAPGTPHNEAREAIWDELVAIVLDRHDDEGVPEEQLRRALRRDDVLRSTVERAWPLIDATDLVGDLWTVPAYLRLCAPWLEPDEVRALQRRDAQAWTVSDLPLLDAARHRLGDPEATRRERRAEATRELEREQVAAVIDDLIAADDDHEGLVTMLRHPDIRENLVDEGAVSRTAPDRLAGPFAHVVVDEAQELTDAEWQMLLVRCPSRSFTIVGDRAQARHGFGSRGRSGSPGSGSTGSTLTSLSINYRTPAEVMTEAEPASGPCCPTPTCRRPSGPRAHGTSTDQCQTCSRPSTPGSTPTTTGSPVSSAIPRSRGRPGSGRSPRSCARGSSSTSSSSSTPKASARASRERSTAMSR